MAAQILPFSASKLPAPSPIARYLRVGEAHQQLANLYAGGRLSADRTVIYASRFRHQREFVTALRDAESQIVLDTEAAELAAPARYAGHARYAPWALPDATGPLGPNHFRDPALNVVSQIARFAVASGFDTVLAPSHFLGDPACDDWLTVDTESCRALRSVLDREGGRHIGIDYPLIAPSTMLNEHATRQVIISSLSDLPINNVWIRVSGLGADAGPLVLRRYLESLSQFQSLGKPLIADYLGGFAGMAALALGAVSGLAQGAGERERFDADQWHKPSPPRKEGSRFGRVVRINMPGLQGSVTREELVLLVSARGGRCLCACGDRSCCLNGYDDMRKDPRGHGTRQQSKALSALEKVHDLRRPSYFLEGPLKDSERLARNLEALRPSQTEASDQRVNLDTLMSRLRDRRRRFDGVGKVLRQMNEQRGGEWPRARAVTPKASFGPLFRQNRP